MQTTARRQTQYRNIVEKEATNVIDIHSCYTLLNSDPLNQATQCCLHLVCHTLNISRRVLFEFRIADLWRAHYESARRRTSYSQTKGARPLLPEGELLNGVS